MKRLLSRLLLAGFALTATAGPVLAEAKPAIVCLRLRDIDSTNPSKDGASIDFKMRNGSHYRNDLRSRCPDLVFSGFKWVIHGPGEVCADQQTIRVLQSGEFCQLGKFTQTAPAR